MAHLIFYTSHVGQWALTQIQECPVAKHMSYSENSTEDVIRLVILVFSHHLSCWRIYSANRLALNSLVSCATLGLGFPKLE